MSNLLQYRKNQQASSLKLLELIGRIGIGQCGIISAYDKQLTAYQNKCMHEKLFYMLVRPGWSITEVNGVYVENNHQANRKFYFVYVYPHSELQFLRSKLEKIGADFNQCNVLYIPQSGQFELINPLQGTSRIISADKELLLRSNGTIPFYLTTADMNEISPNVLEMGQYISVIRKLKKEQNNVIKQDNEQN